MASDNLVEQILASARERGEQVLQATQADYDERYRQGLNELTRSIEERRERENRQAEDGLRQRLSGARLEQNKQLVSLRRRLIDDLYRDAWEQVSSGDAYRAYLDGQLRQHAKPGDRLVVSQREADRFAGELSDLLSRHGVTLAEERGKFRAGFIIERGPAGRAEERLNCTLDQTFRQLQEDTEIEAAQLLFEANTAGANTAGANTAGADTAGAGAGSA